MSSELLPKRLGAPTTETQVAAFLGELLPRSQAGDPAAALLPWVCDRLRSPHSRKEYARDLRAFVEQMEAQGVDPLEVTGDHLRLYKGALLEAGYSATSIGRKLSVLRGTYEQFAKRGLLSWEQVRDIQGVESPKRDQKPTPYLSEREAIRLLHTPDRTTPVGIRDYALLFVFFKTAARASAIAGAKVGHLMRTETDYYLLVTEKGKKTQRKALLEAAPAVLAYLDAAGIRDDLDGPLFRPVGKDRKTFHREHLTRWSLWEIVKRHARRSGIDCDRLDSRGVGVHSLRATAITNALQHGAKIEHVQQLAGHADIRTTQGYYHAASTDAENAARHIQIR